MKTIDEHIDELAQEARDLEKKLTLMSDLKKCMREGHTWQFTVEDTFSRVDKVRLFCTNCGAEWLTVAGDLSAQIVHNDAHNLGIDLTDLEDEENSVSQWDTPDEITQPSESEYSAVDHKDVLKPFEEYDKSKLFKQVGEE
tara:strand:+ start:9519 stop:9941 length:423 start_codon:yes stop_codon:yes gene_type:complete